MKVLVLNGPNLGRLGIREPDIYGATTYNELVALCQQVGKELSLEVDVRQTDEEGVMIGWLHEAAERAIPVVLNAAAWTHYSIAIRDAAAQLPAPLVEVHISNVHKRESFRHHSCISAIATGVIVGLGVEGYLLALRWIAGRARPETAPNNRLGRTTPKNTDSAAQPITVESYVHSRRRETIRSRLQEQPVDALLVTDPHNVRYLTGFTGSNSALLVHSEGDEASVFCTDGRYRTQSERQVPDLERMIERSCALRLATHATELGTGRLGFESHVVTVDGHAALAKITGPDRLIPISRPVEALRVIKEDSEVISLRTACALADTALAGLLADGGLRPGRTEREVARDLDARMVDAGAAGPSFETIVASGTNSAVPHHRPSDAQLCRGDLLKLDFGALVEGYHSDMTRTLVLGPPASWQRELYDLVAAAQAAGRAALRPGADVREVDAAAREVIKTAGHGEEFVHGLGHGVGLQIHEAPALSQFGVGTLAAGMAVTVEPGVYLAGRGGVRIEDTLVVSDGEPELLTLTTKDLVVVPC